MEGRRLLELLAPVRRRMQWLRVGETALLGGVCGAGAGLLLALAARLLPVAAYRPTAAALVAAGGMLGAAYALLIRRVTPEEAARRMDASGEDDAIRTALQYVREDAPIAVIQREDAVRRAEEYVARMPKAEWSPALRRNSWLLGTGVLALALVLALPSPMDAVVAKRQEEAKWVEEQKQQVEQLQAKLAAEKLPPEAKKPMEQTLQELEEGLNKSKDAAKALDEMEKAMKELAGQEQTLEKQQARAERFAEQMKQQPMLKQLGESLRQLDAEAMRQSFEDLRRQVLKLTPEQKEALAKALEKLAAGAANPDAATERKLREAMEKAAAELKAQAKAENGGAEADPKALEEQLKELDKQLAEAVKQLQQNAAQLAAAALQAAQVAQLGMPMAGRLASQGAALSAAWTPGGLADSLSAADGADGASDGLASASSAGSAAGAGATGAAGQGAGAGAGGVGQGAGAGAGAGSGSGTGQGGGTGGLQGGFGNGARNLVTTPRGMEGFGNVQKDGGPTKGGGDVQKGGPSPTIDGATRPYEEVYSEYATEAKSALDRHPLPQSMQNLVRDYFTEIQPNR
ncbi:hypothetical protein [Paenibacillus hamazuiensis]|uniref:hypothetical protein n=1 Tax=Paenibacillus hamazuiensis TaxID=2936508 RepID=UPI00200CD315|nr:hypothetical protein [Paenibacillus hamazuiensis]